MSPLTDKAASFARTETEEGNQMNADLTEEEIEAGCIAAWAIARLAIIAHSKHGRDPGEWHEQPPIHQEVSRLELRAALRAIADLRLPTPEPRS